MAGCSLLACCDARSPPRRRPSLYRRLTDADLVPTELQSYGWIDEIILDIIQSPPGCVVRVNAQLWLLLLEACSSLPGSCGHNLPMERRANTHSIIAYARSLYVEEFRDADVTVRVRIDFESVLELWCSLWAAITRIDRRSGPGVRLEADMIGELAYRVK